MQPGSYFLSPPPFEFLEKEAGGMEQFRKPPRNRPDHDGRHKLPFERNKKILFSTQTHCAICGQPVNFDLKPPDPGAPSVDHIIPIAKGGHPSDLSNLQLAHLGCNRKKGTKIEPPRQKTAPPSNRSLVLSSDWKTS